MSKFLTTVGWEDAPHLDRAARRSLAASFLPHELKARTQGVPSLGSGAIYPVPEEDITIEPFQFPAWYRHAYALDVGWNRTACLWGAVDPDTDTLYLYDEYYRGQAEPAVHAEAIKARGAWIPGVVDPASRGRGQKDGEQLFAIYSGLGLALTPADNAREAGLLDVWQRLSTGRLKVFRTLSNFFAEYRIYRRDEKGQVVKENDHLMDTCRYLCRSGIALAAIRPFDQWVGRPGMPQMAKRSTHDSEHDPYASARAVAGGKQQEPPRPGWTPGSLR